MIRAEPKRSAPSIARLVLPSGPGQRQRRKQKGAQNPQRQAPKKTRIRGTLHHIDTNWEIEYLTYDGGTPRQSVAVTVATHRDMLSMPMSSSGAPSGITACFNTAHSASASASLTALLLRGISHSPSAKGTVSRP